MPTVGRKDESIRMAKHQVVKDVELNPFCAAFPEPTADEYAKLRDSIKSRGQQVPIMLDKDGKILDGRTRFRVCQELFFKPKFAKWKGRGSDELYMNYVIDMNMHRRHLNTSQRAMIAAKFATLATGEKSKQNRVPDSASAENEGQLSPIPKPETRAAAAKKMVVSEKSVDRAAKVIKQNPKAVADVESGKKTVHAALKEIEPEPVAEPEDIKDPFGNKLPAHVATAFTESVALTKIKSAIDAIRRNVQAMAERSDPLATFISMQAFESAMLNAAAAIRFGVPYCLCPQCSGDKCDMCKRRGWLPKEYYEQNVAKELRWKVK